ncbi:protein phosphatase 1 regulatory subunit 1C isoform X3 [Betta splendens]|uniref:Protein phosphatase 1 regulatory subunit 1C isoform X3 n=1 Tax=Betta splendens TaxID=158456 RepID=A0A6P7PCY7_BETSP|nr:protein phosphatase 1 regulatory subunit 1C isoform X3 [Betta splendens]
MEPVRGRPLPPPTPPSSSYMHPHTLSLPCFSISVRNNGAQQPQEDPVCRPSAAGTAGPAGRRTRTCMCVWDSVRCCMGEAALPSASLAWNLVRVGADQRACIRRRRPTPATLQIYRQPGTDVGDQHNASGDSQASESSQRKQSTFTPPPMTELQQGAEQHLLEAGLCDTHGLMSPITAQLYELWANHNGPEETNGNEAGLQIANQERGVAESSSTGDLSCDHKQEASSPDSVSR